MNVEDIKTYIKVSEELNNLCCDIFLYVKQKYEEQLEFGSDSTYDKYYINEKDVCIAYFDYDCCDYNDNFLPNIPLELLQAEISWKLFLDDYYQNKIKEEEEKKAKEERIKENKERELYEKLKEKYGTEKI